MKYEFRAWDDLEGEMLDHQQLLHIQEHRGIKNKRHTYDIFDDRGLKIMASLGIEDANGIVIYEGDILVTEISKMDKYAYLVLRNPSTAGFVCKPFKIEAVDRRLPSVFLVALPSLDQLKVYKPVVIGNIHENPELLFGEI